MTKITREQAKEAWTNLFGDYGTTNAGQEDILDQYFSQTCETCKLGSEEYAICRECTDCSSPGGSFWEPKA